MNLKKRDFQRVVHDIKDFLGKLEGSETAELRDSLNYSLLNLHKFYKRLRNKSKALPLLDGSLSLSSSLGSFSPASPYIPLVNKFEWRWINLDATQLSASFGHGDKRNFLPEIFYVLKEADIKGLKEIVEKDPDSVNEVDVLGRSTIAYCIHGRSDQHLRCLDFLIQHGADIQHEANDGHLPIHLCALCNNEKALDRLLAKKVNVNVEDNEGRFPIHLAAGYSDKAIVKKLLAAGCDKNSLDNDEMTPVMWACYFDNYETMEILLNISIDDDMRFEIIDAELNDQDKSGKNIIHWSVSRTTSKECFKVLFNNGYATYVDNEGKTPLHHIAENGAVEALEEYLTIMGDEITLDVIDQQNRTPLHFACMGGHGELVDILLNRGASIDVEDETKNTPFDYVKQKNLNYCILVILSHLRYRQKQQPPSQITPKPPIKPPSDEQPKIEDVKNYLKPPATKQNKATVEKRKKLQKQERYKNGPNNSNNRVLSSNGKSPSKEYEDVHVNGDFDSSTFDTPQAELASINRYAPGSDHVHAIDERVEEKDEGGDSDISFNDQMIVLVQHQGSDDELVIDVDHGIGVVDNVNVEDDADNNDEDRDLFDIPFARNGSITTVGVVSEGSMAFQSVTADPSVSSLMSSSIGEEEDYTQRAAKSNSKIGMGKKGSNSRGGGDTFPKQPPHSDYSPRIPPSNSPSDVTAPVPPPSHYYESRNSHAEVLVLSDDIEENEEMRMKDLSVDILRPKTSKGRKNSSSSNANKRQQRNHQKNVDSWSTSPSLLHTSEDEKVLKASPPTRNSTTVRLAPISLSALPKPPSYQYDD